MVKIVHPGGHVELHDRPVSASEIMLRNPRCCIAHPNVFKQPWAVLSPDTTLMLGQKFYVVPITTIRKLQHHSRSSRNTSSGHMNRTPKASTCLFFKKSSKSRVDSRRKVSSGNHDHDGQRQASGSSSSSNATEASSSSETQQLSSRNRRMGTQRRGTQRRAFLEQWQPSLHSISE